MIQTRDVARVIVGGVIGVVVFAAVMSVIATMGLAPEPGEPMYWLFVWLPEVGLRAVVWATAGVGVGGVWWAWQKVSPGF